jgi:hypothetical protein
LLVVVFSGLETTHAHSDLPRASDTPCLICLALHVNAPAVTVHPLPVLFAVAIIAIPYEIQGNGLAGRLELFTRPPPSCFR